MSDTSIQSKPNYDALVCEELPPEEQVCEEKLEHHYDDINEICEPEVVAISEYHEDADHRITETIRVDEQKALERRARPFEEEARAELVQAVQPQNNPGDLAQQTHALPHSHGEEIIVLPQTVGETEEAASLVPAPPPLDLSGLLCYCGLSSDANSPQVSSAREMVLPRDREPILEPERAATLQLPLGLLLTISKTDYYETISAAIFAESSRSTFEPIDFASIVIPYQLSQIQVAAAQLESQEIPSELATLSTSANAVVVVPESYNQSLVYYSRDSRAHSFENPGSFGGSLQGGVLLFGIREVIVTEQTAQMLVVLPPSWVTPRQSGAQGLNALAMDDSKAPYVKVRRGSDAHNSRDSHQQGGNGSHGRQPRYH